MEQARVVLPATPLFEELYLCAGGMSVCFPGHSFGPEVRINYLIHVILSGKGVFETDEMRYHLCQGQGFLIEPGLSTFYCADTENPWNYLWIGFNGTLAPQIIEALGLGQRRPVFSCPSLSDLSAIMKRLLLFPSEKENAFLYQHTLLLSFLSILSKNSAPERESKAYESRSNYYITRALKFIRDNYSSSIQVTDVANYLGISRNYLFTLFQETMGHSPQEYISSFCLGRARELLTTTSYSVSEIGVLCGYRDPDVFSKAFKRKYLSSPSQYRKYTLAHPEMNPIDYIRALRRGEGGN